MCVNFKEDDVHPHTHMHTMYMWKKKRQGKHIGTLVVAFERHWKPNNQKVYKLLKKNQLDTKHFLEIWGWNNHIYIKCQLRSRTLHVLMICFTLNGLPWREADLYEGKINKRYKVSINTKEILNYLRLHKSCGVNHNTQIWFLYEQNMVNE